MYVGSNLGHYGGLGGMWGASNAQPSIVDPKHFIPQKYDILNADQASLYLKRPADRKPPKKKAKNAKEGGVYWTSGGPQYSRKKIKQGRKAEKVPAPKTKFRANVEVVRDLPKLKLAPIPGVMMPKAKLPPKASPKAKSKAKSKAKPAPKEMSGFSASKKGGLLPILVLGLLILGLVRQ